MHYVLLLGTFDAHNKGHRGVASGAITNVTAVALWPSKATEPR
jgi:hypothetical protein